MVIVEFLWSSHILPFLSLQQWSGSLKLAEKPLRISCIHTSDCNCSLRKCLGLTSTLKTLWMFLSFATSELKLYKKECRKCSEPQKEVLAIPPKADSTARKLDIHSSATHEHQSSNSSHFGAIKSKDLTRHTYVKLLWYTLYISDNFVNYTSIKRKHKGKLETSTWTVLHPKEQFKMSLISWNLESSEDQRILAMVKRIQNI